MSSKAYCSYFYEKFILTCLMNSGSDDKICYKDILENKECINKDLYEFTLRNNYRALAYKNIYKREIYTNYILLRPFNFIKLTKYYIFYDN